jgi:colanic acid biosynthesis glycosyl transferase WcaI
MTRIVDELVARGHRVDVVTALPWYRQHRIEPGWTGKWVRCETVEWGTIRRVTPFPGSDRTNLVRRAAGFLGFSILAAGQALRGGRVDAVIAMSPPLTLGLTGWLAHLVRRGPLIFNIQDVFPDAAIETGAITQPTVIRLARWLERVSYHRAAAVTVLSEELAQNVAAKMRPSARERVHVIPNFVDTEAIVPLDRHTAYRHELGIGDEFVVMYAGNVGFSQSLELLLEAARQLPHIVVVINGDGAARASLERSARDLTNVRFGEYQPRQRLSEVLATGDLHVVPLKAGLGAVSVPSKTYSILAAGRPVVAAIDADTEVPRLLAAAGAGVSVPPDVPEPFVAAIAEYVRQPERAALDGAAGRAFVEGVASPAAVAERYEALVAAVTRPGGRRPFWRVAR